MNIWNALGDNKLLFELMSIVIVFSYSNQIVLSTYHKKKDKDRQWDLEVALDVKKKAKTQGLTGDWEIKVGR